MRTSSASAASGGPKPNDIGDGLDHAIVIGQAMAPDLIQTAPSALAGAATGLGYSTDAAVLLGVAQYLRNLGYRAVPSMNDTALAIPLAIKAGLGEYGRHGMVITPEFGARVRFGKIFTDMPLAHDVRVCPWTRDYSRRRNRIWRRLAGTPLRRLMLRVDDRLAGGARLKPKQWWARAG